MNGSGSGSCGCVASTCTSTNSPAMRGDVIAPLQSHPCPPTQEAESQHAAGHQQSPHYFFQATLLDYRERRLIPICAMTPKSDRFLTQLSPF